MAHKFYCTIGNARIWTERRRYNSQTFAWLAAVVPDIGSLELGDPWPCARPPIKEVHQALAAAMGDWLCGKVD